jgi:DNA-binding FadR family transcriptional regulator
VDAPSAGPVIDAVAVYLARRGLRPADLAELRTGVEVALVGLAADRVDGLTAARLQAALHCEEEATGAEHDELVHLHAAVAAVARNRVLELVALALIRLCRLHQIERVAPRARREASAEMLRAHRAIAEAVEAGDRELARHRMRRHLVAIAVTD